MPSETPTPTPSETPTPSLISDPQVTPPQGEGTSPPAEKPEPTPEEAEAAKAADTKLNPFKLEEIKLPEGVEVDQALATKFVELVNAEGIPRPLVQKLVALQEESMKSAVEARTTQWNSMNEQWRKESQEHPEFGGAKFNATMSQVAKVVNTYGTPELKGIFDLTGVGNNPHFIQFLAKIGATVNEPGPVVGTPPAATQALEARLYPTMKG